MSDKFSRKFVEAARLPSRSLAELKEAAEDATTRIKRIHGTRVGGEPFSVTALVNCILAWWAEQPVEVQDGIALAGAERCNKLLEASEPQPITPGDKTAVDAIQRILERMHEASAAQVTSEVPNLLAAIIFGSKDIPSSPQPEPPRFLGATITPIEIEVDDEDDEPGAKPTRKRAVKAKGARKK